MSKLSPTLTSAPGSLLFGILPEWGTDEQGILKLCIKESQEGIGDRRIYFDIPCSIFICSTFKKKSSPMESFIL
jgi:hypothetical protein